MSLTRSLARILAIATLFGLTQNAFSAEIAFSTNEDGIYAVFSTNNGEFAAKLYYELAPITVANFVGLAEGSVVRWDENTKQPIPGKYYDGLTFHRVINGFMIQGGSRNGLGTDNPGYSIPDEIVPTLTHKQAGVLSMAKSGPNSGGSQFFITLAPTNWLDGVHSVFGEIVSGQDKVNAIGSVAVKANPVNGGVDKPVSDVVINAITILRVGTAAQQFDPRDYDVPNVLFPPVTLDITSGQSKATLPRKHYAQYIVRRSTDLIDWDIDDSLTPSYDAPDSIEIDLSSDLTSAGKTFIDITEITNVHTLDATGTKLTISLANTPSLVIDITGDFTGTYTFDTVPGTITGYYWYTLEARDQLYIGYSNLQAMQLYFTWTTETSGTVYAHVLGSNAFNTTGTFTATQRPSRH